MILRRYVIVIEKADGNYSAYSPDLPGCAATGATPEQTKALMQEAIALHIRGMAQDHVAVPEPSAIAEVVEVGS